MVSCGLPLVRPYPLVIPLEVPLRILQKNLSDYLKDTTPKVPPIALFKFTFGGPFPFGYSLSDTFGDSFGSPEVVIRAFGGTIGDIWLCLSPYLLDTT